MSNIIYFIYSKTESERDYNKFENINGQNSYQYDDNLSIDSCPIDTTLNKEDINFKDYCDYKLTSKG